jgi:histidine ammonia-lyase
MMALRINALAKGHSGVRVRTIRLLVDMLKRNIVPVVPSQGSVGASRDLVQLAHLTLAMIGKGSVWVDQRVGRREDGGRALRQLPAKRALRRFGLTPAVLEAKEGLALVNGTQRWLTVPCGGPFPISMMTGFSTTISLQRFG